MLPIFVWLNRVGIVASAILGLAMLFGGDRVRDAFPVQIGPLTLSTWGAWLVGLAAHQLAIDRWRKLEVILPSAIQSFGFYIAVATYFTLFGKLLWGRPLAYPVAAIVVLQCVTGVLGIIHLSNAKPRWQDDRPAMPRLLRLAVIGFVALSLYLGVKLLITSPSAYADPKGTYPEMLTESAARVFGLFYFIVGLSAVPAALSRSDTFTLTLARAGLPIVVTITLAALLHWSLFDLRAQPGAAVYLGVYAAIAVIAVALIVLRRTSPAQARSA